MSKKHLYLPVWVRLPSLCWIHWVLYCKECLEVFMPSSCTWSKCVVTKIAPIRRFLLLWIKLHLNLRWQGETIEYIDTKVLHNLINREFFEVWIMGSSTTCFPVCKGSEISYERDSMSYLDGAYCTAWGHCTNHQDVRSCWYHDSLKNLNFGATLYVCCPRKCNHPFGLSLALDTYLISAACTMK